MASIYSQYNGRTRISVCIRGLENPARNYQKFRIYYDIHVPNKTTYSWKLLREWVSTSSQYNTEYVLTPELSTWTAYAFKAEAMFNGVWYNVRDGNVTIFYHATKNTGVYTPEYNWGSRGTWIGIYNGLSTFNTVTATEWNKFLTYLNAQRKAKGKATSGLARMSKGDVLTASYFRSVVLKVEEVTGTIFTTWSGMSVGDPVKGEFFIKLARALNKVDNPPNYDGTPQL